MAPASICSASGRSSEQLPLPVKPRFMGYSSAALSIIEMFQGPGVEVTALVPSAGPVPPPIVVVTPEYRGAVDLLRADEVDSACPGRLR